MESDPMILVLFSVMGTLFAAIGIYFMAKFNKIAKEGTRTKAKIIDFETEISDDTDGYETTYYYPIIEFTDRKGNNVRQKVDFGSTSKISAKTIDIFYLLEDGKYNVVVNTTLFRYFLPWGFFTVGAFCVLLSFLRYLGINPLDWINLK